MAQKKRRFEIKSYYILFPKHVVYGVMYSQYENLNILMWEK